MQERSFLLRPRQGFMGECHWLNDSSLHGPRGQENCVPRESAHTQSTDPIRSMFLPWFLKYTIKPHAHIQFPIQSKGRIILDTHAILHLQIASNFEKDTVKSPSFIPIPIHSHDSSWSPAHVVTL